MQVGVKLVGRRMSWDEAFKEAQNPLRDWPYTADMLALVRVDEDDPDREPGMESFTPTRIMGCHRQAVLLDRCDTYVDMDMAWPLVRGHMVHALMEKARYPGAVDAIREERLRTTIETKHGPQVFTGKPDLIVIQRIENLEKVWPNAKVGPQGVPLRMPLTRIHIKVVDYKSKAEIRHDLVQVAYEHELQVSMYAWLATRELGKLLAMPECEVVVDEVEVVYVDMRRVRRFTSAGWLHDRGKRISIKPLEYATLDLAPIHLWRPDQVARFVRRRIEERLDAIAAADNDLLPACEYVGTEKEVLCNYCPVRDFCRTPGATEAPKEEAA